METGCFIVQTLLFLYLIYNTVNAVTVLITSFSYVFAGIAIISTMVVVCILSAFIIGVILVLACRRKRKTDVML